MGTNGVGLLDLAGGLPLQRGVARLARSVELGLGLPHRARLPPALQARVIAIALIEAGHGLPQFLEPLELVSVFLELAHGICDIGEQVGRQRWQGFAQRIRQQALIGLLGELRLAQLDQRVDQGVVALLAEVEQALVHGPAVAARIVEYLAGILEALAQPLFGEHDTLLADKPQVLAHAERLATVLDDEVPGVDVGARSDCEKTGAECEEVLAVVGVAPAELDPRIARTPLLHAEQQVPGHPLTGITIRLDARGLDLGVEQERQCQRQNFGFAGAVIAPQQEVAVPEPELLAVEMEQLDEAEPERLPAPPLRPRQRRT